MGYAGAKCIECKGPFNRQASKDRLRCPKCLADGKAEPHEPEWKAKLKKMKPKR
jgi:reverse gyrase